MAIPHFAAAILDRMAHQRPRCNRRVLWSEDRKAPCDSRSHADRIGIFKVYSKSETEIVLGEDDKHLDFRLSVLRTPGLSPSLGGQLTVSTVVHCNNLLGRAYLLVIAPFHRQVVTASLHRAAHIGWPKAGTRLRQLA